MKSKRNDPAAVHRTRQQAGVTLIELLIVVVVLAILLATAVPALQDTVARNQLLGQANELASAMSLARSEAVTRGLNAGVCSSDNGTSCAAGTNLIVFIDSDGDSTCDPDTVAETPESPIRVYRTHDQVDVPTIAATCFNQTGRLTVTGAQSFEIGLNGPGNTARHRTVTVAPSGVVTIATTDA